MAPQASKALRGQEADSGSPSRGLLPRAKAVEGVAFHTHHAARVCLLSAPQCMCMCPIMNGFLACLAGRITRRTRGEKKEAAKGRQKGDSKCAGRCSVKLGVRSLAWGHAKVLCNGDKWVLLVAGRRRDLGKRRMIRPRSPWC